MLYRIFIAATYAAITFITPAFSLTAKQKMEACVFGADDQKLKGTPRKTFISRCMANERVPAKPSTSRQKE